MIIYKLILLGTLATKSSELEKLTKLIKPSHPSHPPFLMDLLQPNSRQPQHIHHSFFHSFFTKKQLTHYSLFFFCLLVITCLFFFSPSHSLTSLAFFSRVLPKHQHYSTPSNSTSNDENSKVCDYSNGKWVRDESYSRQLYSEECPFLDPGFRCRRNGRSDVDYVNWRWQPKDCHLPRYMFTWSRVTWLFIFKLFIMKIDLRSHLTNHMN